MIRFPRLTKVEFVLVFRYHFPLNSVQSNQLCPEKVCTIAIHRLFCLVTGLLFGSFYVLLAQETIKVNLMNFH
jgi:hypothetical protein